MANEVRDDDLEQPTLGQVAVIGALLAGAGLALGAIKRSWRRQTDHVRNGGDAAGQRVASSHAEAGRGYTEGPREQQDDARKAQPEPELIGEPGEVIAISTTTQVVNYTALTGFRPPIGSAPQLFMSFMACNSKGRCIYSNAFNAQTGSARDRQLALQRFIQRLKQSGWQPLSERSFKWSGSSVA